MNPNRADDPERVTYHAVSRYVQRILNVDVPQEFETEKARAHALVEAAGTTVAAVRALIWTKGMSLAARLGMKHVGNGDFTVMIAQPEGVVVTVLPARHRDTGRLKLLSDTEMKTKCHRIARRAKARTATNISMEGTSSDDIQ